MSFDRPDLHWIFKLKAPTAYVAPPDSALKQASLGVADFFRARSENPQAVATLAVIAGAAARFHLPECDLAWAVHDLAKRGLLEVNPPLEWSPHSNLFGCIIHAGSLPDGTRGQLNTVELPFDQGAVAPTEALWVWRRDHDSANMGPVASTQSAGGTQSNSEFVTLPDSI
jgi:hypothetical protein